MLEDLVGRFTAITRACPRPKACRRTLPDVEDARARWSGAQLELWHLAQAIAALAAPPVQAALDAARRQVIRELHEGAPRTRGCDACLTGVPTRKLVAWFDIDVTPEVAQDPSLHGRRVSGPTVRTLPQALRAQIAVVAQAVRDAPHP